MRKHSARKWLHFVLDLMPIILIPIFMIYSHRHDPSASSSYTEEIDTYYESNYVDTYNDLVVGNIYEFNYKETQPTEANSIKFDITYLQPMSFSRFSRGITTGTSNNRVSIFDFNGSHYFRFYTYEDNVAYYNDYFDFVGLVVYNNDTNSTDVYTYLSFTPQQIVSGTTTVVYTFENDIMGAFMNNFNYSVNNYFNMSSVFNMGDIYNWINANMFGGNAPMVISSIYNIIVYEFIMDLIFLMYSIFMFIIDFSQELLSRCFSFSRHGGSR